MRRDRGATGPGPELRRWALLMAVLVHGALCGEVAADPRPAARDLTERPWLAHLRDRGIAIDLGHRSRHKHTLGDGTSGWRGDFAEGGLSFSSVVGLRASVFVDAFVEEVGGGSIAIAVRAGTSDTATVSLNGIAIGWFEAPRDRFEVIEIEFDEGIVAGTNEIAIEPDEPAISADLGCPALDVDYLLVRAGDAPGSADPPPPSWVTDRSGGLSICPGCSLTFNALVDDSTRLEVEIDATATIHPETLEIAVRAGSEEVVRRLRIEAEGRPCHLSVPLDGLSGEAVSISFAAGGAPISIARAALVADAVESRDDAVPAARNLLVVLVDTLRADRLRIHNSDTRVRTPNISRLAQSSVVFERAMAPESWTKPSVTSLLTGIYPDRHAVQSHAAALPPTLAYAPEILGRQGFDTAAFVGNGYISEQHGFARGWETWRSFGGANDTNVARRIVDTAARWLLTRPSDRRFFAYVHTVDPHAPYAAPDGFRHLYVQRRYRGALQPVQTAQVLRDHSAGRRWLHAKDRQRLEDLYGGEITYCDFHLGRLLDALRSAGLTEDTLVVVTADHGEEFLDHGSLGHGYSVYEELVHVPLVFRLPGGRLRGRVAGEVGLTDVLPTACDLLEVECPPEIEGRSLVGALADPVAARGGLSFTSAAGAGVRAARASRFKVVCRGVDCALYDLELDPGETTDVGAGHPIALAALRDALGDHLGRTVTTSSIASSSADGPEVMQVEMDDETRRQLEVLGYLDN